MTPSATSTPVKMVQAFVTTTELALYWTVLLIHLAVLASNSFKEKHAIHVIRVTRI